MTETSGLKLKIRLSQSPERLGTYNTYNAICKAFAEIEKQDLTVNNIVMHPNTYKKYLPWKETIIDELSAKDLDVSIKYYYKTNTPLFSCGAGYIGNLFTATVKLSNLMPENKILFTTAAEYIGAMPIRSHSRQPYANLYIAEEGQVIINEKSILTLELT
jgi:hypothetical protein